MSGRVVLAARASTDAQRLIAEGAALARMLDAELVGLFVEAADLLRVAALPVASEIGATSGAIRGLELADTVRMLERQAQQVRRLVEQAAAGSHLRWSFEVARGDVVDVAVTTAAGDLVLIAPAETPWRRALGAPWSAGRPGPSAGRGEPGGGGPAVRAVAAVVDGGPAGERALAAARRLAGDGPVLSVEPGALAGIVAPRAVVVSTGTLAARRLDLRRLLDVARSPVILVP